MEYNTKSGKSTQTITGEALDWGIRLDGLLDEKNTRIRYGCGSRDAQLFQPNKSIRIVNTGTEVIKNPWVSVNHKREWRTVDEIVEDIEKQFNPFASNKEKILTVWRFFCENLYDSRDGYLLSKDPVVVLNSIGFAGCYHLAILMITVFRRLGFEQVKFTEIGNDDHSLPEVFYDGSYHMVDSCLHTFFLDREGREIVGIEDLQRDPGLMDATIHHYGVAGFDETSSDYYRESLINDWVNVIPQRTEDERTMSFVLRPGESLTRFWGQTNGKYALNVDRSNRRSSTLEPSEGTLVYEPDLKTSPLDEVFSGRKNACLDTTTGFICPSVPGMKCELVLQIASPYLITGGRLEVGYSNQTEDAVFGVDILVKRKEWPEYSIDGWKEIYSAPADRGESTQSLDLDEYVASREGIACFDFLLRIRMIAFAEPGSVALTRLKMTTNLQCATYSLPGLDLGENHVSYRDDTGDVVGKRVEVTQHWEEAFNLRPPSPPELRYPVGEAVMADNSLMFSWEHIDKEAIEDYHIQVSEYPDCRWPVSPNFERYISRTRYSGQTRWSPLSIVGLITGCQYYWRVRTLSHHKIWSDWSQIVRFTIR